MKYKVRLTKVKSNHSVMRTDTIEGLTEELPSLGKNFTVVGKSLTVGMDCRVFTTTEIQFVENLNNEFVFNTLNSVYKLEVLENI